MKLLDAFGVCNSKSSEFYFLLSQTFPQTFVIVIFENHFKFVSMGVIKSDECQGSVYFVGSIEKVQ